MTGHCDGTYPIQGRPKPEVSITSSTHFYRLWESKLIWDQGPTPLELWSEWETTWLSPPTFSSSKEDSCIFTLPSSPLPIAKVLERCSRWPQPYHLLTIQSPKPSWWIRRRPLRLLRSSRNKRTTKKQLMKLKLLRMLLRERSQRKIKRRRKELLKMMIIFTTSQIFLLLNN